MNIFEKQPSETFKISVGITDVISTEESIVIADTTIVAIDCNGNDVTSTLLDLTTKTIYDTTKVQVRVKASGEEALSPYKITFLIITDSLNKFEVDVYLRIRED